MGFVNITILHAKLKYSVVVGQIQILFELQRKQKTKATHLEKKKTGDCNFGVKKNNLFLDIVLSTFFGSKFRNRTKVMKFNKFVSVMERNIIEKEVL